MNELLMWFLFVSWGLNVHIVAPKMSNTKAKAKSVTKHTQKKVAFC